MQFGRNLNRKNKKKLPAKLEEKLPAKFDRDQF